MIIFSLVFAMLVALAAVSLLREIAPLCFHAGARGFCQPGAFTTYRKPA